MRAVIDRDIIVHVTPQGDTEIGSIPPGVGLERLRFDGERLVDLAELSEIWVEPVPGGGHVLHAVEVPGSQLVTMRYADRKNLISENGTIRIKATQEVQAEKAAQQNLMRKNRLRSSLKTNVGDAQDQLADACKILYSLLELVLTGDEKIRTTLLSILPDVQGVYTAEQVADTSASLSTIKAKLTEYYASKEPITTKGESL